MSEKHLTLDDLPMVCPRLTPAAGQYMSEAAAVCLAHVEHGRDVILQVAGEFPAVYRVVRPEVTDRMRGSYDLEEATEFGACGIAILVMRDQTGLTVQRAFRGGGFDYWLGRVDEQRPFQQMARLEVSGILRGNRRRIAARTKEKWARMRSSNEGIATYVAVVEFSTPQMRVETR